LWENERERTVTTICPTDAELRELLLGRGPDSVGEHLIDCPHCGSKAGQLVATDPLLADLRAAHDTSEVGTDGTFVEELLKRVRKAPAKPVDKELDFLDPPQAEYSTDLGLFSHYRIVEKIGQGGMGLVFRAVDTNLQRTVALKIILPKYAENKKLRDRFIEEARATVKVRSPHVAEVYETNVWRDVPYLTMELLVGTTLDKKPKPMPLDAWRRVGYSIAKGLADAHRSGMIHRDLKPSNIHLGTDSRTGKPTVKLIDFGLARPVNRDIEITKSGELLGTPAYMSPEQARGKKVDHRTDLYSLGVILHQLATGKLPYDSADEGVMAILTELATPEPLTAVSTRVAGLPPALANLIDRLLAKDPANRPASADEVMKVLRDSLNAKVDPNASGTAVAVSEPFVSVPDSTGAYEPSIAFSEMKTEPDTTPGSKPSRRWLWPALGIGTALAALLIATAMGAFTVKVKTKDGTVIELADLPEDAEVLVDGEVVTVEWDKGKQKAEVRVKPGTRTVEVRKDGFRVTGEEITLAEGDRKPFTVRLEKLELGEKPAAEPIAAMPSVVLSDELVVNGKAEKGTYQGWEIKEGRWNPMGPIARDPFFRPGNSKSALLQQDVPVTDYGAEIDAGLVEFKFSGLISCYSRGQKDKARLAMIFLDADKKEIDVAYNSGFVHEPVWKEYGGTRKPKVGTRHVRIVLHSLRDGTPGNNENSGYYSNISLKAIVTKAAPAGGTTKAARITFKSLDGHTDTVQGLAFSPDGTRLLSGGADKSLRLWSVETGGLVKMLEGHEGTISSISFSSNGERAATNGGHKVWLWDMKSASLEKSLDKHESAVRGVAFINSGLGLLATADGFGKGPECAVWNPDNGTIRRSMDGHKGPLFPVAVSSDGKRALTGGYDGVVAVWDLEQGKILRRFVDHASPLNSVSFSRDGRRAASASGWGTGHVTYVWEVETGNVILRLDGVARAILHPDGSRVVGISSRSKDVQIWSVPDGKVLDTLAGHRGELTALALSADGDRVATGSKDQSVRVWTLVSKPAQAAPAGSPLQYFGYAFQGREDLFAGIATHTNILFTRPEPDCLPLIDAARKAKRPLVFTFSGKLRDGIEATLFPLIEKNRDVVAGACWVNPYTNGYSPNDVADFGKAMKRQFPGLTYFAAFVEKPGGKHETQPVPDEVDVVQVMNYHDGTPETVRAKTDDCLPVWLGKAKGRPVVLVWTAWDRVADGLVPKTQPGTFRACVEAAKKHKIAGVVFDHIGDSKDIKGIESNPTLLKEVEALGAELGITGWLTGPKNPNWLGTATPFEPSFTNALGMKFVRVPKGTVPLGGRDGRPGTVQATIAEDFYLGTYEVTQEEWRAVMGTTPALIVRPSPIAQDTSAEAQKRFPVNSVTWLECREFAKKLNERLKEPGWEYRLPTEKEWEYACRGGPSNDPSVFGFSYYAGEPSNTLAPNQANFGDLLKNPCKVGSYAPNRLGLYDMHGNVSEWCNDEKTPPERDASGKEARINRGGSHWENADYCRPTWASRWTPNERHRHVGLRIARVPIPGFVPSTPIAPNANARTIDLLALVDVDRDSVKGKWTRGADGISSDNSAFCRIKFPYGPVPAEYDFRVEFTAKGGGNDVLQLLSAGGSNFSFLMGAWGGKWDGFDAVTGHPLTRDGTNIIGGPTSIKRNTRHTVVISVRKDSVSATIDGKLVVKHATNYADLRMPNEWKIGDGLLGLGTTIDPTTFHKAELVDLTAVAVAPAPAPVPAPVPANGFVSLFNGQDRTGWLVDGGDANQWTIENGAIVGRSKDYKSRGHFLTDKEYSDFTLKFEFQVGDAQSHGAVDLRAEASEKVPMADKTQIFDHPLIKLTNPTHESRDATGSAHWLKSSTPFAVPANAPKVVVGQWHAVEITVKGDTCTANFDGVACVDLKLDPVAPTPFGFVPGLKRTKGKVGFQINTGTMRYRNVSIQELAPTVSAPNAKLAPLFNGKDLTGWEAIGNANATWKVENGELVGGWKNSDFVGGSTLATRKKDYRNFRLRVTAKPAEHYASRIYALPGINPSGPGGYFKVWLGTVKGEVGGETGRLTMRAADDAPLLAKAKLAANEWNTIEIEVRGNRVQVSVDGVKTADQTDDRLPAAGHAIGLHLTGGSVLRIKSVEIEELESPAAIPAPPAKAPVFIPLFNGKDINDWKRFGNPKGVWKIEDGVLKGSSPLSNYWGGAELYRDDIKFREFQLRVEAQPSVGNPSRLYVCNEPNPGSAKSMFKVWLGPGTTSSEREIGRVWYPLARNPNAHAPLANPAPVVKPGEWFTMEVTHQANRLTVDVNGVRITDEKNLSVPASKTMPLVLDCGDGGSIAYRKIEIRELK
jgi:serine/threonine protein kinase/formylglycine-generating enzyme required for sulfatase activity/WD40 repeat protein